MQKSVQHAFGNDDKFTYAASLLGEIQPNFVAAHKDYIKSKPEMKSGSERHSG